MLILFLLHIFGQVLLLLYYYHNLYGNKWAKISVHLPGRYINLKILDISNNNIITNKGISKLINLISKFRSNHKRIFSWLRN